MSFSFIQIAVTFSSFLFSSLVLFSFQFFISHFSSIFLFNDTHRARERERDTHTHTHRETQRDRERDREIETETVTKTERYEKKTKPQERGGNRRK